MIILFCKLDPYNFSRKKKKTRKYPPESPLLFIDPCGKDAAGLITALLHLAVGVSEPDVVYHYQMSASLLSPDYVNNKAKNFAGEDCCTICY
jgi:hypothetical protein